MLQAKTVRTTGYVLLTEYSSFASPHKVGATRSRFLARVVVVSSSSSRHGSSGGTIAAVVIVLLLVLAGAAVGAVWYIRRRKRTQGSGDAEGTRCSVNQFCTCFYRDFMDFEFTPYAVVTGGTRRSVAMHTMDSGSALAPPILKGKNRPKLHTIQHCPFRSFRFSILFVPVVVQGAQIADTGIAKRYLGALLCVASEKRKVSKFGIIKLDCG